MIYSPNTQACMKTKKACEIPSTPTVTLTMPKRKSKREFTPLDMSYYVVFEYLHSRNVLYSIGPTPHPEEDQKGPN